MEAVEAVEAVEGEVEPPLDADEILTGMKKDGKMFFRVRWVGYGSDDDRDEPEENVQNTIAMMQWQDTGRDTWAAGIEELKRKRTEREAARGCWSCGERDSGRHLDYCRILAEDGGRRLA